ncbi:hypothetical protein DPEC_G00000680 [Dallia pectoralis]|uniref:Uncharacterized protein n=1 Tax=Dallia pectoralis TaxID=75939 RepID=A0ACC2HIK0_DALPE|nr:hypothetical protein DPEC_G00000680 [Dallia pectoralis]
MVVDYNLLEVMLANPLDRLTIVHWLEETDHVVTNKKSVQEIATQEVAGPQDQLNNHNNNHNKKQLNQIILIPKEKLGKEEQRWYLYYLEALFILKHMQRQLLLET